MGSIRGRMPEMGRGLWVPGDLGSGSLVLNRRPRSRHARALAGCGDDDLLNLVYLRTKVRQVEGTVDADRASMALGLTTSRRIRSLRVDSVRHGRGGSRNETRDRNTVVVSRRRDDDIRGRGGSEAVDVGLRVQDGATSTVGREGSERRIWHIVCHEHALMSAQVADLQIYEIYKVNGRSEKV